MVGQLINGLCHWRGGEWGLPVAASVWTGGGVLPMEALRGSERWDRRSVGHPTVDKFGKPTSFSLKLNDVPFGGMRGGNFTEWFGEIVGC